MDAGVSEELAADLTRAMRLFLKGSALEEEGQLRDAVIFYRKAVQLVPDVEQRVHELSQKTVTTTNRKEKGVDDNANKQAEEVVFEDLPAKFSQIISQQGTVALPNTNPEGTHISRLPPELILLLLRWIVSSELDFRSWARFSEVCRGFYLAAHDNELWRLICKRQWGCAVEGRRKWRVEFDRRPRVRVDGCYIARVTYARPGELSFQTSEYLPWHTVQYFRLVRFFTGGLAFMLTSAELPKVSVGYLRTRRVAHPQVLRGHYKVNGTRLTAELTEAPRLKPRVEIRRRGPPPHDSGFRKYLLELEIAGQKLIWSRYSIETTYLSGQKSVCELDLNQNQFPAFNFARVRSYVQMPSQEML
ncbi:F-box only protein 9 [Neocloeon triangulifer]|uniref:F-box only protein 9 n=1 Tax=Neocloeon triangulifer TaxID=2078957 RepID=UPI00286EBF86|nr:F-box only protein 9 [Neocloeon triangulifer]